MKKIKTFLIVLIIFVCSNIVANVSTDKTSGITSSRNLHARAGDCVSGKASINLDVNNIRAMLLNTGDLYWDRTSSRYEAPKRTLQQVNNNERALTPLFAGSIWISGLVSGNLRMAALRYSSDAKAFWPGPIAQGATRSEKDKCNKFDNFWSVSRGEIDSAKNGLGISQSIYDWPGRMNPHLIKKGIFTAEDLADPLAPFYDADGDCIYNPDNGDLPSIKMSSDNKGCQSNTNKFTYADQMIFWVINDVGNEHVNPSSTPIGVQMNCLAFAFTSTDELNDMTFYTYDIHNKSNVDLEETYMSQYMDADLGNYSDDYIGCDTTRSLGFVYNADAYDEPSSGSPGYLDQVPIFGADFFEGPKKNGVPIGMSSFVYYINQANGDLSDPTTELQYRNFQMGLTGKGLPLTVSNDCITQGFPTTKYCFYGDPSKVGEWSMCDRNYPPRDLRWAQNSGPFTMKSGTSETVTIGLIFVRPPANTQQGCRPVMKYLQDADDKAQRLFDFAFEKSPGPDAPDLKIIEASNSLYFTIENPKSSNNYGENYNQKNIDIPLSSWNKDTTYVFEGYLIYQVVSENAISTLSDLDDPEKAKLLVAMDKKNNISKAVNFTVDNVNGQAITNITRELSLPNKGIEREMIVDKDLFQFEGQSKLSNNKTYYYATVAFAFNNYSNGGTEFQKNQLYFSNAIKIFKGSPHNNDFWGVKTKAEYFQGIPVKRISGQGHGSYFLNIKEEDETDIVNNFSKNEITYLGGQSPFLVKVIDPFKLKDAKFKLTIKDSSTNFDPDNFGFDSTYWEMDITDNNGTQKIYSEGRLDREFSQSIYGIIDGKLESYGISVTQSLAQPINKMARSNNTVYGYIDASITYSDSANKWLTFLKDADGVKYENWIISGSTLDVKNMHTSAYNIIGGQKYFTDSTEVFSKILGGTFAPYCLAANANDSATLPENQYQSFAPGFKWNRITKDSATIYNLGEAPENNLDSIYSVDLVITKDKSKWSNCLVFETGESQLYTEGNALKGQLRQATGTDKNGSSTKVGVSHFPGYAINLETGVRMNVCFGENSRFKGKGGANMVWDPDSLKTTALGNPIIGGSQFIYILNTPYDDNAAASDADFLQARFNKTTGSGKNEILDKEVAGFYRKIAWTCVPLLANKYSFYNANGEYEIPSDIRIKVRVEKPFRKYLADESVYEFSTEGMGAEKNDKSLAASAFEKTMLVPNPYYAFSAYELNATQNIVKIVNVPKKSTVSIYTTDGILVRKLKLDDSGIGDGYYGSNSSSINYDNAITWDLRTSTGVLVSSGVYYVNIDAPEIGSKVLKLFAVMRSADVSNF